MPTKRFIKIYVALQQLCYTLAALNFNHPVEINMSVNFDQFSTLNNKAADSLLLVANTVLTSTERITALNLNTLRNVIEDGTSVWTELLSSKDPQAAVAIQTTLIQGAIQKLVSYNQSLFALATQVQQDISGISQGQVGGIKKTVADIIQTISQSAPAGSEAAVAALKQAVQTANTAFENMNTVSKQFSDLAQDNVSTVTSAVTRAVNSTK
jgi:phasin family protein